MKLTNARLCLDCDEVHEDNQCPMCASESFAFIKRWVTTPEKRARAAAPATPPSETVATYRALLNATSTDSQPTTAKRLLRGGALGLAVLGAAGWILHRKNADKNTENNAENNAKTEPDSTPETPA
jgi:hypothetical protein